MQKEYIIGVAIKLWEPSWQGGKNYISLKQPYRHNSLFPVLSYLGYTPPYTQEQGFETSENRFVSREEAWKIAEEAGQLLYRDSGFDKGILYSENLW